MVIGGDLFDRGGVRIQHVIVALAEPSTVPGRPADWAGKFDLDPHAAVRLMHQGSSLRLRLQDGREGWCAVTEVDFHPGALISFRGSGSLAVPTLSRLPR